jgi:hypothetical protein
MTYEQRAERIKSSDGTNGAAHKLQTDPSILHELAEVLAAHPGGLRRWSVMRAIRTARERGKREIPQKLEDDVERTFRRFCADPKMPTPSEDALFYRPREKAGEVWAAYPERIKALLAENDNSPE